MILEVQPLVLFILHWRQMSCKDFREEHIVRAPVDCCNPSDSQRQVAGAEDVGGEREMLTVSFVAVVIWNCFGLIF